jgi:hypothetical protein
MNEDDAGLVLSIAIVILFFLALFLGSSGCVTMAKQIIAPTPVPTPVPTTAPTDIPTPVPTPSPIPTLDWTQCGAKDNCYRLKDWAMWYRRDANNFGEDLRSWFTVYDYKVMKSYHYHSVSWARSFKETALPGWNYLFIFVNLYSDGDDARQYIFPKYLFNIQVRDQLYSPEDEFDPTLRITELDDMYDYAHVQTPVPYPYKIIQEKGTGIIRAEEQQILYSGRSNAVDGYIVYQIPESANLTEIKVAASLRDLGGMAYWKLV